MPVRLVVVLTVMLGGSGCGPSSNDGGAAVGEVGTRCDTAGDCDAGLVCVSEFFFERKVCTKDCAVDDDCSAPSVCVDDIPNLDGITVGPYCLRPCVTQADCEGVLGSDCDTHEALDERYCF